MPRLLVDISKLDLSREVMSQDELRAILPHRHEFQLIDGVCHLDPDEGVIVGYKDWTEDAWWARGHVPGRPLMPGVLMCEGGAQISTVLLKSIRDGWDRDAFIGLGGLENVRFRGQVTPPGRVYFVARSGRQSGDRMAKYPTQAVFEGKMVMDMVLIGVRI